MDVQLNSSSDYVRFERIISQFLLKALHLILESRIPSFKPREHSGELLSDSTVKNSDKWFNLVLGDRPATLEKLQFWHRNLMDPMVIDIIVVHRELQSSSGNDRGVLEGAAIETVIERWIVQYESHRSMPMQPGDNSLLYKKMYQKSIVLFRCLCSMMRLLPAYRIFKQLSSSNQVCDIDIIYKVSSFGHPFSREEEKLMKQYSFNSIEAVNGRLCVSVSYRSNLSDFNLEDSASFPPVIIPDYVGSPATNPMRAFPSMDKVSHATSFSLRGVRPSSSMPSERPHSWSGGIHGAAAFMENHPFGGSPPVHRGSFMPQDDPAFQTSSQGQRVHNYGKPRGHYKTSSYDESLSPPFSPSSSPSAPTYFLSHSPSQSRFRPESAPVAIPRPVLNRSPRYLSPNLSDPSRQSLPPLSLKSMGPEPSSHGSSCPSGNRLSRKLEALRPGESYGEAHQSFGSKVSKDGKDESGRFSGLLSSGSSPHRAFSRTSSRLSFQDELDVDDFSLPFDVDDVDTSDSQASQSLDARKGGEFDSAFSLGRKSQDAAVGALVRMLRTAPPLRQDSSFYSSHSQSIQQEGDFGTATGFFMPRKAADALDELKSYREMKDLLLSKSGNQVVSREDAQAPPLDIKGAKI